MMLRSASTPVLGSLVASFSESPNNIRNLHYEAKPNTNLHHSYRKFSIYQSGLVNHTTLSANSSPISPSVHHKGFRRTQSDDNLARPAFDSSTSCKNSEDQSLCDSQSHVFARRPKCLMLETIPSFSMHNSKGNLGEDDEEEEEDYEEGKIYNGVGNASEDKLMKLSATQEVRFEEVGFGYENEEVAQSLFIEKGSAVGTGDGGRSGGGGDGEDKPGLDQHYKRMVEENPRNSLFLGNYAQFLYQSRRDLKGAEEYYSRAILADPGDGGVLARYAYLVWELHHDHDTATSYFERALIASPEDSHVQAAYAHFLWEAEDDEPAYVVDGLHSLPANVHD